MLAAIAFASGNRRNSAGVTMLTRLSVHWAESMTATTVSNGLEKLSSLSTSPMFSSNHSKTDLYLSLVVIRIVDEKRRQHFFVPFFLYFYVRIKSVATPFQKGKSLDASSVCGAASNGSGVFMPFGIAGAPNDACCCVDAAFIAFCCASITRHARMLLNHLPFHSLASMSTLTVYSFPS